MNAFYNEYKDRSYVEWDRNNNGRPVKVYREPKTTEPSELKNAEDFVVFQKVLQSKKRLKGQIIEYTPRDWEAEAAEAKQRKRNFESKNAEEVRQENERRETETKQANVEIIMKNAERKRLYANKLGQYEIGRDAFVASLGAMFMCLEALAIVLFVAGLLWDMDGCGSAGGFLCKFVVAPTMVCEFIFIVKYTRREQLGFEEKRETIINV
jgi:hypothetical protein